MPEVHEVFDSSRSSAMPLGGISKVFTGRIAWRLKKPIALPQVKTNLSDRFKERIGLKIDMRKVVLAFIFATGGIFIAVQTAQALIAIPKTVALEMPARLGLAGAPVTAARQLGETTVQFTRGLDGEMVTMQIDGRYEQTFAGKLEFQDANGRTWQSVCADIRSPMAGGTTFGANMVAASKAPGNVPLAGRIVAQSFDKARTPAQCAGLQIAVWEALEYGAKAVGNNTSLRVIADPEVLGYAHSYYLAGMQAPPQAITPQQTPQQAGSGQAPQQAGQGQMPGVPPGDPTVWVVARGGQSQLSNLTYQ